MQNNFLALLKNNPVIRRAYLMQSLLPLVNQSLAEFLLAQLPQLHGKITAGSYLAELGQITLMTPNATWLHGLKIKQFALLQHFRQDAELNGLVRAKLGREVLIEKLNWLVTPSSSSITQMSAMPPIAAITFIKPKPRAGAQAIESLLSAAEYISYPHLSAAILALAQTVQN